jgi:hypothetical protein
MTITATAHPVLRRTSRPLRSLLAVLLLAGGFTGAAAGSADAKIVSKCILKVKGKTYVNGPCEFIAQSDGSFSFDDNQLIIGCYRDDGTKDPTSDDCGGASQYVVRSGSFGGVSITAKRLGTFYWNQHDLRRANDFRQQVRLVKGCWVGATVRLCIYA